MALGVVMLVASLALSGAVARAQDQDNGKTEMEKYKQRMDALEKKLDQIEAEKARKEAAPDQAEREKDRQRMEALEKKIETLQSAEKTYEAEKAADVHGFRGYWKDHLYMETYDKNIILGIGARMNLDGASINGNHNLNESVGKQMDATDLRRFRLHLYGTFYDDIFFKLQPEFSIESKTEQAAAAGAPATPVSAYNQGLTVGLKDVYVAFLHDVPNATVRIGHFQEPFNLEELANDQDPTFMERGLPDAFAPSYQVGIMAYHPIFDQRMTWWAGLFRATDNPENLQDGGYVAGTNTAFSQFDGGYDATARVTGLPIYKDNGNEVLHLGFSATIRDPKSVVVFAAKPEMYLASNFVNTGVLNASQVELQNAELLGIAGPFSIQSEVTAVEVNRLGAGDCCFNGGYVLASYILTGEHRGYDRSIGYIDRLIPSRPLGSRKDGARGWGAVELAARFSWIDLNSNSVRGGRLEDETVGLNWYLNPNVRLMFNYVLANLNDAPTAPHNGVCNMFAMRLGMDF
jgi:phosphate-selective porin OprO/OprP